MRGARIHALDAMRRLTDCHPVFPDLALRPRRNRGSARTVTACKAGCAYAGGGARSRHDARHRQNGRSVRDPARDRPRSDGATGARQRASTHKDHRDHAPAAGTPTDHVARHAGIEHHLYRLDPREGGLAAVLGSAELNGDALSSMPARPRARDATPDGTRINDSRHRETCGERDDERLRSSGGADRAAGRPSARAGRRSGSRPRWPACSSGGRRAAPVSTPAHPSGPPRRGTRELARAPARHGASS